MTSVTRTQSLSWRYWLALLGVIALCLFMGLGSYPIENVNEGLYAEIAREMLMSGHYLIPHLNHVPYLEKPPLLYWLMAFSMKLFGLNAFAARIIPAISAVGVVLITTRFAQFYHRAREGFLAGIILASGIGFILISRVVLFDMLLTCLMTITLVYFYVWYTRPDKKIYLRAAYLGLGLAMMTKGFVAPVLVMGIVVTFHLWQRVSFKQFIRLIDPMGIALCLVIFLPWLIAAADKLPGFIHQFVWNEQIGRFFNFRYPRDYHSGPLYFYIPVLLLYLFPWSLFTPSLFIRRKRTPSEKQWHRFLWAWMLVPFVFFSLAGDKGNCYMLVSVPAFALLLANRILEIQSSNRFQWHVLAFWFFWIVALLVFLILGLSHYIGFISSKLTLPDNLLLSRYLFVGVFLLGVVVMLLRRSRFSLGVYLGGFVLLSVSFVIFLIGDKQATANIRSEQQIVSYMNKYDAQRPVYVFQNFETISSLFFYEQRRVNMIESISNDLYYGSRTPEAKGWFVSLPDFTTIAKRQQPVFIVIKNVNIPQFINRQADVRFCRLITIAKVSVLSNRLI